MLEMVFAYGTSELVDAIELDDTLLEVGLIVVEIFDTLPIDALVLAAPAESVSVIDIEFAETAVPGSERLDRNETGLLMALDADEIERLLPDSVVVICTAVPEDLGGVTVVATDDLTGSIELDDDWLAVCAPAVDPLVARDEWTPGEYDFESDKL